MSEQTSEQVEAPENPQVEEQTSQTNEQQQSFDKDKFFRGAYNEGKQKVERDVVNTFSELFGDTFESFDDVVNVVKDRVAQKPSEDKQESKSPESEELRKMIEQYKADAEQARQELKNTRMQSQITQQMGEALSTLSKDYELSIDKGYVERLFGTEYEIKESENGLYVSKDGAPMLDDSGNRKSVSAAFAEFAKQFSKPKKAGVGGSTGGGVAVGDKPKFSEFTALINSQKSNDRQKAAEMRVAAKEMGWDDQDSPTTFKRKRF